MNEDPAWIEPCQIDKSAHDVDTSTHEKPPINRLARRLAQDLRAKLDAAILAEQWAAVSAIAARIRELEAEQKKVSPQ